MPSAPTLPGICSDFACKSKLAVQAELLEKVIKDKEKVNTELTLMKAEHETAMKAISQALSLTSTDLSDIKEEIKNLQEFGKKALVEKAEKSVMTRAVEISTKDENDGMLTKDNLTINLREAYNDYFRLRDSNTEGRSDVFSSLYTQAKQIDLERRKLQAEVEVLRLKDQNNALTLQDLEGMFRDPNHGSQDLRELHR